MMPILELQIKPTDEMTTIDIDGHLINDTLTIYHHENNYLILSAERTIPLQKESILKSEYFIIKISLRNNDLPAPALISMDTTTSVNHDFAFENVLAFLYEQNTHYSDESSKKSPLNNAETAVFSKNNKPLSLLNEYFQPPIPCTPNHIFIASSVIEDHADTAITISHGDILRDLGWLSEQETPNSIREYHNFLQQPLTTNLGYQDE